MAAAWGCLNLPGRQRPLQRGCGPRVWGLWWGLEVTRRGSSVLGTRGPFTASPSLRWPGSNRVSSGTDSEASVSGCGRRGGAHPGRRHRGARPGRAGRAARVGGGAAAQRRRRRPRLLPRGRVGTSVAAAFTARGERRARQRRWPPRPTRGASPSASRRPQAAAPAHLQLARSPSFPAAGCAMALALAALAAVEPACGSRYQQVSSAQCLPGPALPAGRFRPPLRPRLWPTRCRGLAGRAGPGRAGRAPGSNSRRPRAGPVPPPPGPGLGRWKNLRPAVFLAFPTAGGSPGRNPRPSGGVDQGAFSFPFFHLEFDVTGKKEKKKKPWDGKGNWVEMKD